MLKNKLFAVAIFTLAFVGATVASAAYTFPSKITTTQQKKDVQTVLNMVVTPSPELTTDGVFGAKTIAAVKAFQTMKGLTADGKIGPMTRAALEAAQAGTTTTTTTVAGCPAGALFNATTGAPCTAVVTTTLPAGCVAGAMFSSTTGASCTTGVVATTTTGGATEGYLVLQSAPVAVVASANQSDVGDAVMAFAVKAKNSDIKIQRVNVHLTSNVSALPWKYLTNISLYNDGTLLATLPVTSTSLTENNFGMDYTAMFDGLNVNIAKETAANFIVKADVVGTIPNTPATYYFDINQSNAVRGIDGIGLSQYVSDTPTNTAPFLGTYGRTINFGTAGTGKLTIVADGSNPVAMNVVTSLTNTTTGITGLVFDVQNSTNLPVNLKTITATLDNTNAGGQYISGYYLYDGGTMIASLGNPGTTALTFTNLPSTFTVAANSTKVLTIKYDVAMAATGSQIVSVNSANVVAVDSNSNLLSGSNLVGTATGLAQTFQGSGVIVNLVSATATSVASTQGVTGYATGTFVFTVKANGVNLAKLSTSPNFTPTVVDMANGSAVVSSTSYTVSPDTTVSDGSQVTITLNAVKSKVATGFVQFKVTGFDFVSNAVGGHSPVSTGLDNFYTNSVYQN